MRYSRSRPIWLFCGVPGAGVAGFSRTLEPTRSSRARRGVADDVREAVGGADGYPGGPTIVDCPRRKSSSRQGCTPTMILPPKRWPDLLSACEAATSSLKVRLSL